MDEKHLVFVYDAARKRVGELVDPVVCRKDMQRFVSIDGHKILVARLALRGRIDVFGGVRWCAWWCMVPLHVPYGRFLWFEQFLNLSPRTRAEQLRHSVCAMIREEVSAQKISA